MLAHPHKVCLWVIDVIEAHLASAPQLEGADAASARDLTEGALVLVAALSDGNSADSQMVMTSIQNARLKSKKTGDSPAAATSRVAPSRGE